MKVVPGELVDIIIGFLYNDKTTLRNCALVSRGWVATSRSHLFRQVTLGGMLDNSTVDRCHHLYDVITASPDLAVYITEIVINNGGTLNILHPYLPLLLPKLTSLESLCIVPGLTLPLDPAPPELMLAIASLPSLTHCRLQDFDVHHPHQVLRILHRCKHIKTLFITNMRFESLAPTSTDHHAESVTLPDSRSEKTTTLERLVIDNGILASAFVEPDSPIDISSLRSLEIRTERKSYTALVTLLHNAPSLERLEFTLNADPDLCPPFTLSSTPHLNTLILQIHALLGRENPLPWLHAVVSSLPPVNHLEDFSLDVTIDMPPPDLSLGTYQEFLNGWRAFDALFVQAKFVALKRVRIDFRMDHTVGDVIVGTIVDEIILQLRELHGMGVLHVDSCEMGFG